MKYPSYINNLYRGCVGVKSTETINMSTFVSHPGTFFSNNSEPGSFCGLLPNTVFNIFFF